MTELDRSLEELIEGEQAQSMESIRTRLKQLDQPEADEAKALAEALAKGDFSEAKNALESMQSARVVVDVISCGARLTTGEWLMDPATEARVRNLLLDSWK